MHYCKLKILGHGVGIQTSFHPKYKVIQKKKLQNMIQKFNYQLWSIHNGGVINLAIWHHKKLSYLFYFYTLQNIQHLGGFILAFNIIK